MKIVIAMDAFKGSLSSLEAGLAVEQGIRNVKKDIHTVVKEVADGGEGTADVFINSVGAQKVNLIVTGPNGNAVPAYYGYLKEKRMAVIESASACGLTLLPDNQKNPLKATTYGLGEMIIDAAEKGCRNFTIGLGGSATVDAGIGMLQALGYLFLDKDGKEVGRGAQALYKTASIVKSQRVSLLKDCKFQIACDVENPLYGPDGATYIYGGQKGVTKNLMESLDQAVANFAALSARFLKKDKSHSKGAGAAGGLGFAFLNYLNAEIIAGTKFIFDTIKLEEEIKDADMVISGEGRLDYQTTMGKLPIAVAALAKKYKATVLAFAGQIGKGAEICNQYGIDAFFSILRSTGSLQEALDPENAKSALTATAEQVFRLWYAAG